MIRNLILALYAASLIFACTNAEKPETTNPPAKNPTASESTQPQYPAKPIDQLQLLYKTCDYVDYTFYELPMSMSFDNTGAIQQVISLLSLTPPLLIDKCKPTGRAFFQKNGEDLAVAEFYLQDGCNIFVFLENGKPAYANLLTPDGINWYRNSISKALPQNKPN